jgi:crotonobetainyl-CoA:carnitine CoA-transferase CaiB-like acyl-CoA transferase
VTQPKTQPAQAAMTVPNHHGEPCGPSARGENALCRWYQTRDGSWLFVAAHPDRTRRLAILAALETSELAALHGAGLAALDDAGLARALGAALRQTDPCTAVRAVRRAGAEAQPASTMDLLRRGHVREATSYPLGRSGLGTFLFHCEPSHPISSPVTMFAPCGIRIRSVAAAVRPLAPQPKLGQHTREVLCADLGYDSDVFERLRASGAVAVERSARYIPGGNPWAPEETDACLAAITAVADKLAAGGRIARGGRLAESADTIMHNLEAVDSAEPLV